MNIVSLNGELAWASVAYYVLQHKNFKSVSGIEYQTRIAGNKIYYKGSNRNEGEEEIITKEEFTEAFANIQSITEINTNTIKTIIPNSLYRKRTPFIGLLFSSGIIK